MGGRNCCVTNCRRRSHDHYGRKLPNGLTFHCFPAWRRNEGRQIAELTRRRRVAWVAAVNRSNITFDHVPPSMRVCSRHFHSGKPAYEMHESDPDWVPSLQMGHGEGSSRRPERLPSETAETQRDKQRWRTEARPSCVSSCPPAVRPWRDVRPLLLSALQRPMDTGGRPGDETQQQTAAVSENAGFRDFFRDALEASLETSSRSRALRQTPVSVERDVELTFQSKASSSSSSSSSCLNCVRLQRRIRELQDQLSQDTEASPASNKTLLQPNQDLQGRKTVLKEPGRGGDFASTSTPSGAAVSEDDPAGQRPRRPPRFQWAWLKMFWFLRYSPTLDEMWCHVCRLHANKYFQNSALAKGSRRFRVHNIKKHSHSNYHKENVQRHLLAESRNAPL
ncbi:uncharacterized protein [Chaetodon trifascialis]|uniref:uncharacterized protein isoform X3 n=1 Tax=Chaetodon trifascialis TaxID=109706 RepID=UPI0039927987